MAIREELFSCLQMVHLPVGAAVRKRSPEAPSLAGREGLLAHWGWGATGRPCPGLDMGGGGTSGSGGVPL